MDSRSFKKANYNFQSLKGAYSLIWQCSAPLVIGRAFLTVALSVLPLLSVYLIKMTVDAVTAAQESGEQDFQPVLFYIALTALVMLANAGFTALSAYLTEKQQHIAHDYISDQLHQQSIRVDYEYYENPAFFDTLHRAQKVAIDRPFSAYNNSLLFVQNGLSLLAMAQVLMTFHWSVTLVLLVAVLPGVMFRVKFSGKLYKWDRSQTLAKRKSFYYNLLLTGEKFAKEVRLYQLGQLFARRYHKLRERLRNEELSISRSRNRADFFSQLITVALVFGALLFMARRAVQGLISIGALVMYYTAFQKGLNFFRNVLNNAAKLYDDSLYLFNLFEFLSLKPRIQNTSTARPFTPPIERGIRWEGVSFAYPGSSKRVLRNIDLHVQSGEHIALVGENGAGKSTFVKLLCRLYDPSAGHIRVDGEDVRNFQIESWRRSISVIFQDFTQFNLRVLDNIWFGNILLGEKNERIRKAAQFAGADELIESLPDGYETVLGKMWERGAEISIGEWQKIALARAFVRDAPILILDEPTASLDAPSEYEVFRQFKAMAVDKTAFFISHRLGSAQLADRIIVLEHGRIIESGSHDQLLQQNGCYARMYRMQSSFYQSQAPMQPAPHVSVG